MENFRLRLAAFAAVGLFAVIPKGPALAMDAQFLALRGMTPSVVVDVAQEVVRLHRKRTKASYCYPKNHWWFYRPYTTGQDDHPRCMPYFHYLDQPGGRRGARAGQFK